MLPGSEPAFAQRLNAKLQNVESDQQHQIDLVRLLAQSDTTEETRLFRPIKIKFRLNKPTVVF